MPVVGDQLSPKQVGLRGSKQNHRMMFVRKGKDPTSSAAKEERVDVLDITGESLMRDPAVSQSG